jgi:hypothetical protein
VETMGFEPASSIAESSPLWLALDGRPELSSIKLQPPAVVQLKHDDPRIVRVDHDRLRLAVV